MHYIWHCEFCNLFYHLHEAFEKITCNKCRGYCELISKRKAHD